MANPQKEDGYTPIAHELLEALIRWGGTGRAKDLVLAVMRETYGWGDKVKPIPAWRLAALLNVGERRIRQLRDYAVACNVLTYSDGAYAVQKDFDQWVVTDTGRKMDDETGRRLSAGPYSAGPTAEVQDRDPQDRIPPPAGPYSADPSSTGDAEAMKAVEYGPSAKAEDGPSTPPNNPPLGVKQESKTANDTLPERAARDGDDDTSQEVAKPQPKPRSSLKRKAPTDAELQVSIDEVRDAIPGDLATTLDLWLGMLASHNDGKEIGKGRELTETVGFAELVQAHGLSTAAIRHGVTVALAGTDRKDNKPGIQSIAFVLEVAKGFGTGGNGGSRPPSRGPRHQPPSSQTAFDEPDAIPANWRPASQ